MAGRGRRGGPLRRPRGPPRPRQQQQDYPGEREMNHLSLSLYNTLLCSVVSTRRAQGCYEELAREKS